MLFRSKKYNINMNIMNIILEAVNIPKYFPLRFLFSFAIYLKLIRLAMDAIRAVSYTHLKVLSYLSARAAKCGSDEFDIPFNRQQLADYLSVDRSADVYKRQSYGYKSARMCS